MKRGDGLPNVTAKNAQTATVDGGLSRLHVAIALAWLIGFPVWFHSFAMPNNPSLQRWMVWVSIPYDLLDLIAPPVVSRAAPWSYSYLLQRVPFLLIAVAIWTGAWGLGSLVLRLFNAPLRDCERLFFSLCLGLSGTSLLMLLLGVCGCMSRWPLIAILASCVLAEVYCHRNRAHTASEASTSIGPTQGFPALSRLGWIVAIALLPFVLCQLLGAMSPQTDFDVIEYHLGGPKEWFQHGQITRLSHNVYTSFPFLTEMLILSGMVVYGDWQWGALAGQATIAGFAPLTAIGLFAAGRRWFSEGTGWLAALVYLTSPWTYRISIIAYAEGGLACYLIAALFAALLFRQQFVADSQSQSRHQSTFALLAGLLAGSAMACKYTGLISVVIPIAILLVWTVAHQTKSGTIRKTAIVLIVFFLGVSGGIGPWLLKNAVETGNPVYPLAVRIFGGQDRDKDLDAKWRKGHAAPTYSSWQDRLQDLPVKLRDVVTKNDWHSPLMFGLAPLSLLWCLRRREKRLTGPSEHSSDSAMIDIVWLYVAWQFFTWWILTHHIDRFYVPMFSAVSLLAGIGARWWESSAKTGSKMWNWLSGGIIVTSILYNVSVMFHVGGFNAGRLDLTAAREIAIEHTAPRMKWINDEYESGRLPPNTKVLCVGEAQLFHARYHYLYNTVFDYSIFEKLCVVPNSPDRQLRPVAEIREEFEKLGITHIDVNWNWILQYREPGNYGYTDFVHPDRFAELQRLGILGPPLKLPVNDSLAPLSPERQERLKEWAPSLITTVAGKPAYITAQIFPVLSASRTPHQIKTSN